MAEKAIDALMGCLADRSSDVREFATRALGHIVDVSSEDRKFSVLNRIAKADVVNIDFFQSLKNVRHIPEDFPK